MRNYPLVRLIVGALALLMFGFLAYRFGFVSLVTSGEFSTIIAGYGILAPLVFMAVYAVATVLFVPGSPLTVMGGVLFGPWWGTVYVVVGATIGATGAFLLARFIGGSVLTSGSSAVAKQLQKYESHLVNNAFITVLILRLVPIFPFNGLNFALGLTRIQTRTYALATALGIIPGTFAYVFFGSAVMSLSWWQIGSAVLFLVLLSIAGKYGLHYFSRTLHD